MIPVRNIQDNLSTHLTEQSIRERITYDGKRKVCFSHTLSIMVVENANNDGLKQVKA